jgi:hypothetical protein
MTSIVVARVRSSMATTNVVPRTEAVAFGVLTSTRLSESVSFTIRWNVRPRV